MAARRLAAANLNSAGEGPRSSSLSLSVTVSSSSSMSSCACRSINSLPGLAPYLALILFAVSSTRLDTPMMPLFSGGAPFWSLALLPT